MADAANRYNAPNIAKAFHENYERLAPRYGYETRRESAVPWRQVPERNRKLMVAVVEALLDSGTIRGPQRCHFILPTGRMCSLLDGHTQAHQHYLDHAPTARVGSSANGGNEPRPLRPNTNDAAAS